MKQIYPDLDFQKNSSFDKIEKDFWDLCKKGEDDLKVRYAADVPFRTFFDKKMIEKMSSLPEKKEKWGLGNVNLCKNSLFQFLKKENCSNISGLTFPWLYFGMTYSTFCWHIEDLYLYSLNYMHYGKPKIWYSIPTSQKEKMDNYIKTKYNRIVEADPGFIHRLILLIDPQELIDNGIKVYKTIQKPGELIVTLPKGYHSGFSLGFNISEAVNFAVFYNFLKIRQQNGFSMECKH
jgi:hypothetical protein